MTTVLEQGNITIHTENIFPIIKKSLYTDHEIFLRELVSNSVDAIAKLKMVSYAGEVDGELPAPEITLAVDKEKKTLSITDNGIGMTADEIKKYINQVAFSSAEEFVEKYQKDPDQQIIGHFGLGFYSCFMVAKNVEIDTLSHRTGSTAVHWSCDGSPQFELVESERTTPGTTITLTMMEEEEDFLEESRIKNLIKTHCDFMPVPIMLGEEQINKQQALWKESTQNLKDEDYLEFYRYLYPFQEEPLLWVHINTDYPFVLNGLLYFPPIKPDMDINKGQMKLFCNQVFVSDNCDEIIPDFLRPLRGVLDSTDIPLNVSRSALTNDRTVRRISSHISKKIADRLKAMFRDEYDKYVKSWQDLGTFVKFGSLKDDKFKDQVADIIIYKSSLETEEPKVEVQAEGDDEWAETNTADTSGYTTLKDYLERNKEKHENRVFYCTDPGSQATYVELYKSQGLEILFMDSFIDTNYFIPFLEREYTDVKFSRVDSELDEKLVDSENSEIVDPKTNKTRSEVVKELFETALGDEKITIKAEALKSQGTPPAMVIIPEELRRIQEMTAMMQQQAGMEFPAMHTLLVNTAHPMVENLLTMSQGSIIDASGSSSKGELVNQMCQHIYDLALISQKPFGADEMKAFVERSNALLTQVTERM